VAKVNIPVRTVVTADMLVHKAFPQELVPSGALSSDADAISQTTLAPIPAGAPVLKSQIEAVGGAKGASLTLQIGKVLVAFPTSDPLTTNGLVEAGDKIDLLVSVIAGEGANAKLTQTTLQNLEVVQVIGPTQQQPQRAFALVFAVDHQVALVLKYLRDAQTTVDVAVRSRAETDAIRTTTVNLGYLQQTYGIR